MPKKVSIRADASPMTTITNPVDLISAVPFLIGYQPDSSIVLMALEADAISLAIRIDFPKSLSENEAQSLVERLNDCVDVLLVSYIPSDCHDSEATLRPLIEALLKSGKELRESIVVVAGRWRSMVCTDSTCCPIEGSPLPELENSRIAAEEITQGKPLPFASLREMALSIDSSSDSKLLTEISLLKEIDYEIDPIPLQREGANSIVDFIQDFRCDGICRDRRLVARVLVRLKDLQVRDYALGIMSDEESDLFFAAWRWLTKSAPTGFIAAPATLFAVSCYERGDGALANLALKKAFDDHPDYPLALLLQKVFQSGQSPALFRSLRQELHPKVCDAIFSGSMME